MTSNDILLMVDDSKTDEKNIILDSIADGVFTVDRDFRITWMNSAAKQYALRSSATPSLTESSLLMTQMSISAS